MIVAGTGDNCGGGIESLWEAVSLTSSPERYYGGGMKLIGETTCHTIYD